MMTNNMNRTMERTTSRMTNVESMFDARKAPWDGLGKEVVGAVDSSQALKLAGLDWKVVQQNITTASSGKLVDGFKANIRDIEQTVLGIVTEKYKVVQNDEAFAFTDALLGEGVKYETAGALARGKKIWLLAKLEGRNLAGEKIDPYLVFTNAHDGKGSVRVAITPIRVWCQNTLNLALKRASRSWSCTHVGNINGKLEDARMTIMNTENYLGSLESEFENMKRKSITKDDMWNLAKQLLPIDEKKDSVRKAADIQEDRELLMSCWDAPDLQQTEKSVFRFVNAVSDFSTHKPAKRLTNTYQENRFMKIVEGDNLIDQAYRIAEELIK